MAKSRQGVRARVSQATGRRRKKPANPIQRVFGNVKQLVSDTGRRVSRSGQRKAATKQASPKKTAATGTGGGKQRQAATKKAARPRGAKTS